MKIKTSDLIGPPLAWAAGRAEGHFKPDVFGGFDGIGNYHEPYRPDVDWAQGGPIIDREKIAIHGSPTWTARYSLTTPAHHGGFRGHFQSTGPTALVAAMRCFVRARLGDEVDIPEELL
jgi:hypothetical protein